VLEIESSNLAFNSKCHELTTHPRSHSRWSIVHYFGSLVSNQGDEMGERVERMGEMRSAYKILFRIPERKRSFGEDSRKWGIT
jgi:hypothetical protein